MKDNNEQKVLKTECVSCSGTKRNPALPLHTCPYLDELYDDDTMCNCCDECALACSWEI